MKLRLGAGLVSVIAMNWSFAAHAGEEPLYQPAPDWVAPEEVSKEGRASASPFLLMDQQSRIEKGRLWKYSDFAVALDSPQALTQFGTLNAAWLPDKGDLIIHQAILLRDGQTIDLLEGGEEFAILRREKSLESRMLDGVLTATMPVTGAQLGDVLRLAFSVTVSDQAMGDEVQWYTGLFAKPFPLERGRVSVSWPKDLPVTHVQIGDVSLAQPVLRKGYYYWSADLPIPEVQQMPGDAPLRFQQPPAMQATTYDSWESVSRSMAPHYKVAEAIPAEGALSTEVARIAALSDDPKRRMAAALESVQDNVSYLMNGLNGGNYLPQAPKYTWEKRYGDCKAKSVLLLAMLQELGIESEAVLVRSKGGDALVKLAPMPANFDHMIVRAEIDGVNYWLDGTTSGTRFDTIDTVPRFHFALPIRDTGAGLLALEERPQATPDLAIKVTIDNRAGIRMPSLLDITANYRGVRGAPWRTVAEQGETDQIENAVRAAVAGIVGGVQIIDHSVDYDASTGVATVKARALRTSSWLRERAIYELDVPGQAARDVGFQTDRARAEWRDIPLRLNGPIYLTSAFKVLLPDEADPFTLKGKEELAETIGEVELTSSAQLEPSFFALTQSMRSLASEIPADAIAPARRDLARFIRSLPVVRSGRSFRQPWEYTGKSAKLLDPIRAAYDTLVAEADMDETIALVNRSRFYAGIYEFEPALKDVEEALAIEESRDLLLARANLYRQLGRLDEALADYEEAEMLQPDGSTYFTRMELLALLGREEEALALAEDYRGLGTNDLDEDTVLATAMGWNGEGEAGLALLADHMVTRPGDGKLLNAMCWHAGTFDIMTSERLDSCTKAVEKAEYSPAVLDSRGLAYLRQGQLDLAKADLDAALELEPELSPSRLLRGIVRMEMGDEKGKEDIEIALRISPFLRHTYSKWGFAF